MPNLYLLGGGGLKLPPDPPAGFAPAWECTSPDPEPSGRLRPQWGNGGSAPCAPRPQIPLMIRTLPSTCLVTELVTVSCTRRLPVVYVGDNIYLVQRSNITTK